MDKPAWGNGRDKRVPPKSGPDKQVPPLLLLYGRMGIRP